MISQSTAAQLEKSVPPAMPRYRAGSMFAGIGGICLAFRNAGADIVWANEVDAKACETYRKNFGSDYLVEADIKKVDATSVPDIDILTAGFPCQAFSVAGYRKGFQDERGILFFDVMRIAEAKKPRVIFLENVKNLETHDGGRTLGSILSCLEDCGYRTVYKVMNTMDYGNIPQNRERIYIVSFRNDSDFDNFSFPEPVPLEKSISDVIDRNRRKDRSFYYGKDWQHYSSLKKSMLREDTLYQWRRTYVRENKSNVCPTLTANMGTGGHNVPLIIDGYGFRKLTPEECLAFQGFPDWFRFSDISRSSMYKQAGNSVSVPVVERIAKNIISAMRKTDSVE